MPLPSLTKCLLDVHSIAMKQGKPLPDYSRSSRHRVQLDLDGELVDTELAAMLRHSPVMAERSLSIAEYQVLCQVACGEEVADDDLKTARKQLRQAGVIKSTGKGRGTSYSLVHDAYEPQELFNGEQQMVLALLAAIISPGSSGAPFGALRKALSDKSDWQIRKTLNAMKHEGLVELKGKSKSSRWVATEKGKSLHETYDRQQLS